MSDEVWWARRAGCGLVYAVYRKKPRIEIWITAEVPIPEPVEVQGKVG